MASNYQDNFIALNHGHLLPEIIINGRYIHRQTHKTLNRVWVGKEYEDPDLFMRDIETESIRLNKEGYNCYVVMNTISPDFLEGYEGKKRIDNEIAAGDKDISERNMILIDIDRSQDTKISATASELKQSEAIAWRIKDDLEEAGFPQPTMIMSGNGNHLQVPLDHWPNTEENKDRVKTFLEYLRDNYSTNTHKIDTVVSNASRITKMIDTYAMKGPNTKVRPWRKAVMNQKKNGELLTIQQMDDFLPDKPALKANGAEPPSLSAEPEEEIEVLLHKPLLPEELDRQRFKEALENFSPDDYRGDGKITGDGGDWLGVMFAGASIGAVEELREWSMRSSKYEPEAFNKVIKNYGKNTGNPLTVRSLYSFLRGDRKSNAAGKLGDIANGELYAEHFIDTMLFVRDTDDVYRFDARVGWIKASSDYAIKNAKLIANRMTKKAFDSKLANPDSPSANKAISEANRSSQKPGLVNMVWSARSCEGMSVDASELDSKPYLLGVKNGILNLDTRELLQPDPSILVTKRANVIYDPDAKAPRYVRFLNECNPNKEEIKFYIRWCGYRMSGYTTEQKFIFMKGVGGNGKSKDLECSLFILGDYADTFKTDVLVSSTRDPQGHDADLLHFMGLRFAWCNETSEGKFLNEQAVKQIVDDGTVTGRSPYAKKQISFPMTAKIQIAGNHAPIVRGTDEGIWRRTLLFNWPIKFHDPSKTYPENFKGLFRDADLLPKLTAEASGILNLWLLGYQEWKELGHLQIPDSIIKATNLYRDEMDIFKQFLSDCCEIAPTLTEDKDKLWWKFNDWSAAGNYGKVTKSSFNRMLRERELMTMSDRRTVKGLSLRDKHPF
jgi:P4 family phage/plasmid primase-like protien